MTDVVPRDGSSTAAALLTRLASETSMLTALSEVLSRHHAEAQQRLAAAGRVADSTGTEPAPVLAIEYPGVHAEDSVDVRPARSASQVLALMHAGDGDASIPGAPRARSSSPAPRDRTPAASGALVVRTAGRAAGGTLSSLLDFALTDSDYTAVLSLLATVGGNTGAPPASAAAIAALPDIVLDSVEAEASCAICLAELGCGPAKALPCGTGNVPHAFHAQCIGAWLRLHNSCPTCRARLAEPDAAVAERDTPPPLAPAGLS